MTKETTLNEFNDSNALNEIHCKFRFIGSPIPLATDQCFRS
jgi:hypothetical protein